MGHKWLTLDHQTAGTLSKVLWIGSLALQKISRLGCQTDVGLNPSFAIYKLCDTR